MDERSYPENPYPAGTSVLALYPETTSFYPAVIDSGPFAISAGTGKVRFLSIFPLECSTHLSVPCICRTRSKIESTRSSSKMMETPSETYRSNLSLSRIPDQALLRVVSLVSSLSLWIVKIPSVPCCKLPWKLTPPNALAVCRENA